MVCGKNSRDVFPKDKRWFEFVHDSDELEEELAFVTCYSLSVPRYGEVLAGRPTDDDIYRAQIMLANGGYVLKQ